jgi:hypothetical protein
VAPPRRGAAEAEQARRLRGDAVGRHELLLLAEGAEETERVHAEAEHAEQTQREQADSGGERRARAPAAGAEHEKRQHDAGAQLDPDPGHERGRARARTRRCACREGQRGGEREHEQRVVVCPADSQHEQHGVQPHERRSPRGRTAQARGGARGQRDRAEARGGGETLQQPQPAGEPQRCREVAPKREQGTVGRVLEGPADECEDGVRGRFGGHVRVGVEAVQGAHAREGEVAEDVLGDQRRTEHEHDVRECDRARERDRRQRAGGEQHEQVAAAHRQHQRLEAAAAETAAETSQRARQPARPAAAAAGHVLRGSGRCACVEQEDGGQHARQPERAERAHDARRDARRLASGPPARCAFYARAGYGCRGLDDAHCYVCPSCEAPA